MDLTLYTITSMYGRNYTDHRTRTFYAEESYSLFLDSFISEFNEKGVSSISYLLGLKTTVSEGNASSVVLCELKREYSPIRELNIKRETVAV